MAFEPVVPWKLVDCWTTVFWYIGIFLHSFAAIAIVCRAAYPLHDRCEPWTLPHVLNVWADYLPVYFQSVQNPKPIQSGVSLLALVIIAQATIDTNPPANPSSAELPSHLTLYPLAAYFSVSRLDYYLPQNFVGSALTMIGFGLLSMIDASSPKARQIGFQISAAQVSAAYSPRKSSPSSLPSPSHRPRTLALLTFVRDHPPERTEAEAPRRVPCGGFVLRRIDRLFRHPGDLGAGGAAERVRAGRLGG